MPHFYEKLNHSYSVSYNITTSNIFLQYVALG